MERTENEKRIRRIFKECFEFLEKYKNGVRDEEWRELHELCVERSDSDDLAVSIYAACYRELARQRGRII